MLIVQLSRYDFNRRLPFATMRKPDLGGGASDAAKIWLKRAEGSYATILRLYPNWKTLRTERIDAMLNAV